MEQKTTRELSHMLTNVQSLQNLESYTSDLPDLSDCQFADYFRSLPNVQKLSSRELILRSGIERTYFYQIMNGTRNPGRDKVIMLSLAAELTLSETQRALKLCNLGILYARRRRDAVISFALQKHLSVDDAQELLLHFKESPLS